MSLSYFARKTRQRYTFIKSPFALERYSVKKTSGNSVEENNIDLSVFSNFMNNPPKDNFS
jgi:hypothetical protein